MAALVTVRVDEAAFRAAMDDIGGRQVPYATAAALTATAYHGRRATIRKMESVFDRPTRYTLNSLQVFGATKSMLVATVGYNDWTYKGGIASRYIAPQVEGGQRSGKRFEGRLMHVGLLGVGNYLVPTRAVPLDAFGNPTRGQYAKIMSALAAQPSAVDNTKPDKVKATGYFWGNPHGIGRGVWQRFKLGHGWALKPMFLEVRKAVYTKRLPLSQIQADVVQSYFPDEFANAVKRIAPKFSI